MQIVVYCVRPGQVVRSIVVAAATLVFLLLGAGPAAALPNPGWPARCPQRLVVVLDLSSSIGPHLDVVKQAATDLADALRGAPNEVAVVTFGTLATVSVPMVDVGNADERQRLKDAVDDLDLLEGDAGGTNWEAAFITAASLQPDIVLFLTDGQPTTHGDPFAQNADPYDVDNVTPAAQVADQLKSGGTRIVGVGMGLLPENVPNLAQVTGPVPDDDYYETSASADGLLDRLYDIAGKACGIPVAALPQPEGETFPVLAVLGGVVGAALLAVVGGLLLSRRTSGPLATVGPKPVAVLSNPTIGLDAVPRVAREVMTGRDDTAVTPPDPAPPAADPPAPTMRGPRRISTARLQIPTDDERHSRNRSPEDNPPGAAEDGR